MAKEKIDLAALERDSPKLGEATYDKRLAKLQTELMAIQEAYLLQGRRAIIVFEGTDAAGKGGTIRRLATKLDPRFCKVWPIAAPTPEEQARHYLTRFFDRLPIPGTISVFDRSWYGRVLVERVEGYASEADWMRAYTEINDFEEQLLRNRTVLVKFWLQISQEEQLRRFQEREQTSFKRFKITPEDWRNREKWDAYQRAICDMIDRTSTEIAPWTLVEAEDKYFARIKVLKTLAEAIERAVDGPR